MNNKLPGLNLLLLIIPLIVASWFLIHLLTFFGVFLAIAYPLWWLLTPKQIACLLCRAGEEGRKCFFCQRKIKKDGDTSPNSLFSAILNGTLILIFSLVSIGLVFGESQLLFKLGFSTTPKTVSFVIPTKGQYRLGEIFPMRIEIVGIKVPINAVQADLGFEANKLEVVDVSTDDSFANIFIQKEINNKGGYTRLTGGLPNPGLFSNHGMFGTVFFKGKEPGLVKIEYLPSSMVLANDGRGTNVLKDLASISYLILPERISPEEEKMQKSISFKSDVLGEKTTGNTQMKFYEEENILGAKIREEIQEEKKFGLFKTFLNGLEKIDRFILEQWEKIFIIFKR